jgi:hypothetical protein
MPGRKHMSQRSDKENRMYEHVKESEEKRGVGMKRAKEIAARTVNKHHSGRGHRRGE